jgi:agmatinase
MDTIPNNFMGLEDKYSRYADARFVIQPIPYDAGTSWQPGARNGPGAIIAASQHLEWLDEEYGAQCYKCGIATMDAVEPNLASPEAMQEALFKLARRIVRDGKFLIGLGGDHSVTPALVRAAKTRHKKLSVLQIDAHLDLRDSYQGSPYSHASAMSRVVEHGVHLVPVGIRAFSPGSRRSARRAGIDVITARACHRDASWIDRAVDALGQVVYVTIDIDGFDPAYAPGTGTPEPGGLDWYQVTDLLRRAASQRQIIGADVVEVMPIPGQVVTEFLAARVIYKLITYVQRST